MYKLYSFKYYLKKDIILKNPKCELCPIQSSCKAFKETSIYKTNLNLIKNSKYFKTMKFTTCNICIDNSSIDLSDLITMEVFQKYMYYTIILLYLIF